LKLGALLAAAIVVAVLVAAGALLLTNIPVPYPIPTANVSVSIPAGLPYRQVTAGGWDDLTPEWSPDGARIAYVSDRGGLWSVWTMNADGSLPRQLTAPSLGAADPSWSPDSSQLAYWRMDDLGSSIVVVDVARGRTFTASGNPADAVMATPRWSPDGSRLLYFRTHPTLQLMCVNMGSLASQVLASVNGSDTSPGWAGKDRVIYGSVEGGFYAERWINLTSGETGFLTTEDQNSRGGVLSPDGTRLAYYSDMAFPRQSITQFNLSGYNVWVSPINLTEYDVWRGQIHGLRSSYLYQYVSESDRGRPGEFVTSDPLRWSADGRSLAVVIGNPIYGLGVYVWSVGTSNVLRVGPSAGVSIGPSWSPSGSSVAFSCNSTGNFHVWIQNTSGAGIYSGPGGY
jgi:Tol biopolymer transport system component